MGKDYDVITQPLDTAQTDKGFPYPGTFLEFATDGSFTGITVRVGGKLENAIPLDRFKAQRFNAPVGFEVFWVTWTAQTGKSLFIFVGRGPEVRRV